MKPSIYLAGPITGLHYSDSIGWRDRAAAAFKDSGIVCFSPLRAKSYLRPTNGDPNLMQDVIKDTYEEHVLSSQRGIFGRDYHDATKRDLIFVNLLGADRISIGTVMEMAWAFQANVPIVLVMEKTGYPHEHAMLNMTSYFRVDDFEEGIHIAKTILLPVPH